MEKCSFPKWFSALIYFFPVQYNFKYISNLQNIENYLFLLSIFLHTLSRPSKLGVQAIDFLVWSLEMGRVYFLFNKFFVFVLLSFVFSISPF